MSICHGLKLSIKGRVIDSLVMLDSHRDADPSGQFQLPLSSAAPG